MNEFLQSINQPSNSIDSLSCKIAELLVEEVAFFAVIDKQKELNKYTEFIMLLVECLEVTEEQLILGTTYFDHLLGINFYESSTTLPLLLFAACCLVSSKILFDETYCNDSYAEAIGVPLSVVNKAESEVLKMLNYKLIVNTRKFNQYKEMLTL